VDHNNGNVLSATIVGNGVNVAQQFTYDGVNRLAMANEAGGWSQGYNYDAFGNLTGGAATGITTAFPASISATNSRITDPGWRYDLAGNVKASPAATSITYDADNRQVSYTPTGLAAASYDPTESQVGISHVGYRPSRNTKVLQTKVFTRSTGVAAVPTPPAAAGTCGTRAGTGCGSP
jgi:YD repeat-containing protein